MKPEAKANIVPNPERPLNPFDIARRRFGAWGVIKGRLLAEVVGEEKAMGMFQAVQDRKGLDRLMNSINLYFQAAIAFVEPENAQAFIEEKKGKILQELEVPAVSYPYIHLFPSGRMQFHSNWGYHFDSKYGRPWGNSGALAGWGDRSYNNEATELYY